MRYRDLDSDDKAKCLSDACEAAMDALLNFGLDSAGVIILVGDNIGDMGSITNMKTNDEQLDRRRLRDALAAAAHKLEGSDTERN